MAYNYKRSVLFLSISMVCLPLWIQAKQFRALFVGNSYTYVNNLPSLISGLATSTGDQLITGSSAIGGYTFQQHSTNATTLSLIAQGDWDYVVLQEQSQLPSFPDADVMTDVYPYAHKLDSLVKDANACAKTVFYMTWGRKNGDQSNCPFFPPLCTYEGMDSMLQLRYTIMADTNSALLSPVARLWRYLRTNNPTLELYDADESHPSINGSYAAACAFYTVFFGKDPSLCTYNASLTSANAAIIRNAAKLVVYDSLDKWYQYYPFPQAQFSYTVSGSQVSFQNTSINADSYKWYFGDGDSSMLQAPVHTYTTGGNHTVRLVAKKCMDTDTMVITVQTSGTGIPNVEQATAIVAPNPVEDRIMITSAQAIVQVTVYNAEGRVVQHQQPANAKEVTLNVSALADGLYYMNIHTKQGIVRKSFVKQTVAP